MMSHKLAKKVRKAVKRNWMEYYLAIRSWPLSIRIRFAWEILKPWGGRKK